MYASILLSLFNWFPVRYLVEQRVIALVYMKEELTCCETRRSSSGPEDVSCLPQPPCFLSLGSPGPAICNFDPGFYHSFIFTCMSLKVRKCINPSELKHDLSSEGSKFLSIRNWDDVREGK